MNKKYHVAIIGAGQLGSRHLQGLKGSELNLNIYIVDPSEASLSVAKKRFEEIKSDTVTKEVKYFRNISQINTDIDLAIIASNSMQRSAIIKHLLETTQVRNFLLEKFLFPSIAEYDIVQSLLLKKGILDRTWVNCTRRMYPFYKQIKEELVNANQFEFSLIGGNWGMACNAVHFIDLFCWLSNSSGEIEIDVSGFNKQLQASKRDGYIEFTGTLVAHTNTGKTLSLVSQPGPISPQIIKIDSDKKTYEIRESEGKVLVDGLQTRSVIVPFQSQLTHLFAEKVLLEKHSELCDFEESAKYHLSLLKAFVPFYNNITGNISDSCPIT